MHANHQPSYTLVFRKVKPVYTRCFTLPATEK